METSKKRFEQAIEFLKASRSITLAVKKQLTRQPELNELFNNSEIPLLILHLSDSAQLIQDVLDAITRREKAKAKGLDLRN